MVINPVNSSEQETANNQNMLTSYAIVISRSKFEIIVRYHKTKLKSRWHLRRIGVTHNFLRAGMFVKTKEAAAGLAWAVITWHPRQKLAFTALLLHSVMFVTCQSDVLALGVIQRCVGEFIVYLYIAEILSHCNKEGIVESLSFFLVYLYNYGMGRHVVER